MIFDKEIDTIIKKYTQLFLLPAIKNIRENLGENSVSEDNLKGIYCSFLENAKSQYAVTLPMNTNSSSCAITPVKSTSSSVSDLPEMELSDSDSSSEAGTTSLLQQALKRKRPEPNIRPDFVKRQYFLQYSTPVQPLPPFQSITSTPTTTLSSSVTIQQKQVFWNIAGVTMDSSFILDFKASRALGIPDLRDRLSNKHPELIRYAVDSQDRDWLLAEKLISPLNKNGKYLLLVLEEVKRLAETNIEYKSNPYVKASDLQGFKIPEFMFQKIQKYFNDINEKKGDISLVVNSGDHSTPASTVTYVSPSTRPPRTSLSSSHATLSALLSTPQTLPMPPTSSILTSTSTTIAVPPIVSHQIQEN